LRANPRLPVQVRMSAERTFRGPHQRAHADAHAARAPPRHGRTLCQRPICGDQATNNNRRPYHLLCLGQRHRARPFSRGVAWPCQVRPRAAVGSCAPRTRSLGGPSGSQSTLRKRRPRWPLRCTMTRILYVCSRGCRPGVCCADTSGAAAVKSCNLGPRNLDPHVLRPRRVVVTRDDAGFPA
jgi:hypothetical protein